MTEKQLGVFPGNGSGAFTAFAVVAILAAQSLFDIAENAIGKGEFGRVEVTLRIQFAGDFLAEILFGQWAGNAIGAIRTGITVAQHAWCWRLEG